jgi:hypothetical protein
LQIIISHCVREFEAAVEEEMRQERRREEEKREASNLKSTLFT